MSWTAISFSRCSQTSAQSGSKSNLPICDEKMLNQAYSRLKGLKAHVEVMLPETKTFRQRTEIFYSTHVPGRRPPLQAWSFGAELMPHFHSCLPPLKTRSRWDTTYG